MRNLTKKQYLGSQERARSRDVAFASYVEDNQRANSAGGIFYTEIRNSQRRVHPYMVSPFPCYVDIHTSKSVSLRVCVCMCVGL